MARRHAGGAGEGRIEVGELGAIAVLIAQRVEDGARPGDVAVFQEVVYE